MREVSSNWAEAFWKKAPDTAEAIAAGGQTASPGRPAAGLTLTLPCVALAAITVLIGLWSGPLFNMANRAGEQLTNPDGYIRAVMPAAPQTENTRYVRHP